MKQSEFGKGCGYCLGLFVAHTGDFDKRLKCSKDIESSMKERYPEYDAEREAASMWFYAAADHLYEFEVPDTMTPPMSEKFTNRAEKFVEFVMARRLTMKAEDKPTKEDVFWAVDEAKELLRLLDDERGIKTIKAEFS